MNENIKIVYTFIFNSENRKVFEINLDKNNLLITRVKRKRPPLWALLNHKRCENCNIDEYTNTYCPVALNFSDVAEQFKDMVSHEKVNVTVTTEERKYLKETTIQQGLSPLIGIIMTTSGCPVMERLKPMVRFHLPFANLTETIFRMVSMYLVSQYLKSKEGKSAEWNLEGLSRVYEEVGIVNGDFANRLRDAAKKDANINALVNLDCFAKMVPLAAEETLNEIRPYFSAYMNDN